MIAKRVKSEGQDSFRRLAEYLSAADDPGEKLEDLWIAGAAAGTGKADLNLAIREIEATQALNTRARGSKTYHLVVSFRDEKPSADAMREIEREFASALGFGEHQRIAATHTNTDNFHLHVAYNKIHPVSGRSHSPSHDFRALEKVCRAMEKKHGLKVDLGREDKLEADRKPAAARDKEAHTWEKSFFTYVSEQKKPLRMALDAASSWGDMHQAFGRVGLALRLRGNGLVIGSDDRKHHVKASALGREFSKAALEKRLGRFQALDADKTVRKGPEQRYTKEPITKHPGQERLWGKYIAGSRRRRGPSLMGRAFRTWRQFLMADALNDPLAMAIIYAHQKMLGIFTPSPSRSATVATTPAGLPSPSKPGERRRGKKLGHELL